MVRPANGEMVFVMKFITWEGCASKSSQQPLYSEAPVEAFLAIASARLGSSDN